MVYINGLKVILGLKLMLSLLFAKKVTVQHHFFIYLLFIDPTTTA
jgi:hypothetical protein